MKQSEYIIYMHLGNPCHPELATLTPPPPKVEKWLALPQRNVFIKYSLPL